MDREARDLPLDAAALHAGRIGAAVAGTALGGVLGEGFGLRAAIVAAAAVNAAAVLWLAASRIRGLGAPPSSE